MIRDFAEDIVAALGIGVFIAAIILLAIGIR